MNPLCFNPLFIRSVFLLDLKKALSRAVEFTFQSLIHQVSVSFRGKFSQIQQWGWVSIPYSSGQCFFCGLGSLKGEKYGKVSIPYSSGQCFFLIGEIYEVYRCPCEFQSLIHQVSVSFKKEGQDEVSSCQICFNPLFIRSVFLFNDMKEIAGVLDILGFNPLFIRSVFLLGLIQDKELKEFLGFNPLFIRSVFLFFNVRHIFLYLFY